MSTTAPRKVSGVQCRRTCCSHQALSQEWVLVRSTAVPAPVSVFDSLPGRQVPPLTQLSLAMQDSR